MAGLRDVALVTPEASWTTHPDEAPVWEEIGTVVSASIRPRGRQYELDETQPTRAVVRVDNSSAAYTAQTGQSGNVTTDKRARIIADLGEQGAYVLMDHVLEAGPTNLEGGFDYAATTLETVDYLDALGVRALQPAYVEHTLWEEPTHFFTLGETPGARAVGDIVGGVQATLVDAYATGYATKGAAALGGDPFFYDNDTTTNMAFTPALDSGVGVGGKVVQIGRDGIGAFVTGTSWGLRVTFATVNDGGPSGYVFYQANQQGGQDSPLSISVGSFGDLGIEVGNGGAAAGVIGPFNDGLAHTVQVLNDNTQAYIYVDGVLRDTVAARSYSLNKVGRATVGGGVVTASGELTSPFTGQIGYVTIFDYAFINSGKDRTAHQDAALGFDGETAGPRIERILTDWCGYADAVALDAGSTVLGPLVSGGQSAATACLEAAATDDGVFFIDGDGTPTFRARSDRYATVPVAVLNQAATPVPASFGAGMFGGPVVLAETPVDTSDLTFDYDRTLLVNDFYASRAGGPRLRFTDTASVAAHRTRNPGSDKVFNVGNDNELTQAARWFLFRYGEPRARVSRIRFRPITSPQMARLACTVRPFDLIRLVNLPDTAPDSSMDFLVESVAHPEIANDEWVVELSLSPWIPVLTLDDPTYGALDSYPLGY